MGEQTTAQEEKKHWFEVDVTGMREFHGARKGWQLAKELVANTFDENVSFCRFSLTHDGTYAHLIVEDDGPGFRNISDAYTILGSTYKRAKPDLRGRFNLGEKEIIAISESAVVETGGKRIVFAETGERREEAARRARGTRIELLLPWSEKKTEQTVARMRRLLPPAGVSYTVNGEIVPCRVPHKTFEATLQTVLLERGFMRNSMRKTEVHLHKLGFQDPPVLFELGIPVQRIECAFHVDVRQKIPMNPNRDAVKSSYLKDLYAEVLNHTIEEVPEDKISQGWVREAVEDRRTTSEVVKEVMQKRFGEKIVLWSSDRRANEEAVGAGYELLHPKELSPMERRRFIETAGLKHASDIFPSGIGEDECSEELHPNEDMQQIGEYAKRLAKALVNREIRIRFYSRFGEGIAASYDQATGTLSFNVARLGYEWFKQHIAADTTSLILHELAHENQRDPDYAHGPAFRRNLEILAGKAVMLALRQPSVFGMP
jgi:hypothetical protein